jgi:hypothetical protein
MAMMGTILFLKLLLREQAPDVPRNCSFLTVHTDDKALTVRSQKECALTVPQLSQQDVRHCRPYRT